jgi:hypothetical protein
MLKIALLDFGWYLGMFVSFVGWGVLFARYAAKDEDVDLGLKVGWGVAVFLALGGLLLATRIAYGPVLIGLVVAGQLAVAHDLVRRRRHYAAYLSSALRLARERPAAAAMVVVVLSIALGRMATVPFVISRTFASDDDSVAYLFYPKQILEAGRTVQPFSIRHALSLNGQAFLQAPAAAVVGIHHAFGLDSGLFVLVSVLVLSGISNRRWLERSPLEMLPELGLSLFPLNGLFENDRLGAPLNLTSHLTGIALLLTLYRTLRRSTTVPADWRSWLTVALPSAAIFTLRPMYVLMVVILLGASYGLPLFRWRSPVPLRSRATAVAAIALFTVILLLPWFITAYRSDGTPFYPVIQGNVTEMPHRIHRWNYDVRQMVGALYTDLWTRTIFIFAFAGLCIPQRQHATLRAAVVVAAFATWVVLIRTLPGNWHQYTARYLAPTFATMAYALAAEAMSLLPKAGEAASFSFDRFVPAGVAGLAIFMNLHASQEPIMGLVTEGADGLHDAETRAADFRKREEKYARMQETTVPGQGILVAAVDGYLFNFERNPVYTIDLAALAAPAPGFPFNTTPENAARYLLDHGVRYVALAADRCNPIDPAVWEPRVGSSDPSNPDIWAQADWSPFIAGGLKELDALAARAKRVFSQPDFVIVDLDTLR